MSDTVRYPTSATSSYADPGIAITYIDNDPVTGVSKSLLANDSNDWGVDTIAGSTVTGNTITYGDGSSLKIVITTDGVVQTPSSLVDSSTWISDMSVVSHTVIEFVFTDDRATSTVVYRNVYIYEASPPVIVINGTGGKAPIDGVYDELGAYIQGEEFSNTRDAIVITIGGTPISRGDIAVDGALIGNTDFDVAYNYTDPTTGLVATEVVRAMTVFTNTGPVITLNPSTVSSIEIGDEYVDIVDASAVDANGVDISENIRISTDLNILRSGTYTYLYTVVDQYGTSTSDTIEIEVTSNTSLVDKKLDAETSDSTGSVSYDYGQSRDAVFTKDMSMDKFYDITDMDNLVQNVYNIIFTMKGERLFNPSFGSRLHDMVFDLADDGFKSTLITSVADDIETQEPRVEIDRLKSKVEQSGKQYTLHLTIISVISGVRADIELGL
jgi:phage baseplate assembly protein W